MPSILPGGCTEHGNQNPQPRPGQQLSCKITAVTPGGYEIFVGEYNKHGRLKSTEKHAVGDYLFVTYVCTKNGKLQTIVSSGLFKK